MSATATTGIAPSAPAATARTTSVNRSGGANGRAASCTATISGPPGRPAPHAPTPAASHPRSRPSRARAGPRGSACASSSYPSGAVTTMAAIAGEAAAAAAATASIGRSPIGRKAFGRSAPSRVPAPAARMIAAACVSGPMRAACQTRAAAGNRRQVAAGSDEVASSVAEDHPAGGGLDHVAHPHGHLRADRARRRPRRRPSCRHRGTRPPDRGRGPPARVAPASRPRADRRPEARRERVDLRDGHPQRLGHERQVVVHRDQRGAALAREPHERRVDVDHPGLLDQLDLHERRLLQLDQDVEPATAARAPLRVGRIGDRLQLPEHALVHQQGARDEPGRDQVGDAPVDQGAGVEHVRGRRSRARSRGASCRPTRRCPRACPGPAGPPASRAR